MNKSMLDLQYNNYYSQCRQYNLYITSLQHSILILLIECENVLFRAVKSEDDEATYYAGVIPVDNNDVFKKQMKKRLEMLLDEYKKTWDEYAHISKKVDNFNNVVLNLFITDVTETKHCVTPYNTSIGKIDANLGPKLFGDNKMKISGLTPIDIINVLYEDFVLEY